MITFLKKQSLWSLVAISFLMVSCNDDDEEDDNTPPSNQPTQTIVEIASGNPDFSILVEALTAADLVDDVSGDNLTVFAPNNEAFNDFFDSFGLIDEDGDGSRVNDAIAALGAETVIETLKYHVLLSEVRAADVPELGYVTTYSTNSPGNNQLSLLVESRSNGVFLNNGPQVSQADILATNGVIHAINQVITMPNIVDHAINNPALLSELTSAVVGANLVGALSDENATLTVFAPRNSGFEAIESTIATLSDEQIATVLTYHVLATQERADELVSQAYNTLANQEITVAVGTSVEITDVNALSEGPSTVEVPNIQGTNGVVHLIDNVLIPAL
jgi:transforming growth factor-beta-induced protein